MRLHIKTSRVLKMGLVGTVLGLMAVSEACINDRDTLAIEAKAIQENTSGLPHVVRIVSGRFERNPVRYYQMRLARVSREIATDPTQLELYDDAATSCDRLHHSDMALRWMERKRQQLAISNLDAKAKREQWYRYYANAGTFHAHYWLRSGTNRADMRELTTGRDMIRKAIEIKPNAHFGREKYQLKLVEWLLNPPTSIEKDGNVKDFLGLTSWVEEDEAETQTKASEEAVTGLSGLIVLGDAWASFDVYYALMHALSRQEKPALASLAGQRCLELLDNGRASLSPAVRAAEPKVRDSIESMSYQVSDDLMRKHYYELRGDAIDYQQKRLAYLDNKFQNGLHPDTHPDFWREWREPELPSLEPEKTRTGRVDGVSTFIIALLAALCALYLGIIVGRRSSAKRYSQQRWAG
jgi:hypothetical protein